MRHQTAGPDKVLPALPDSEHFWHYCVCVYSTPGVMSLCLDLQDSGGADVNLMLLFLWCDQKGLAVSDKDFKRLVAVSREWQNLKLNPLRARRRTAKGTPDYSRLKADELALEAAEQRALLVAVLDPLRAGPSPLVRYLTDLFNQEVAQSASTRLREARPNAPSPAHEGQTNPAPD